jgi:hypothetical protein
MASTYPPTGSQPPSVELTVRQGPQPGQRFSLTRPTITIGREAGNDVVINDPQISRRHANLTWDGRQFIIQDLGSANGTFVNGVRLTGTQVLQQGAVIGLGPTVLLGFQVMLPVVSPAAPPAYAPRPPARRRGRFLIPLTALLGLCILLAAAAAAGYYFLWPRPEARPVVLINSPRHGQQVPVGQEITIQSIARDEQKIARIELWVDGQLQEAQSSSLPGGASPFPLLARWQPSSPGTHTLIARAFNAQGARGQASINVEAIEEADRDSDGVADEADACLDEPGPPAANGCPDRDGDGIPDAEDACPDEPGLPEGEGCPVSREGDRDGDGLLDEADACPDEPGRPRAEGCPDADGDGVRDSEDACPDAPGLPEHDGCLVPEDLDSDGVPDEEDECPDEVGLPEHAGCPDWDGDGIHDGDDECPGEPGPEPSGCPDRDGDSVPDHDDLRPDEPGRPEAGGAPDTGAGDSDGDGIPDDADLCPEHAGLPQHAGCPPPPGSEEEETEVIPLWPPPGGGPFGELGGFATVIPVEFEALEFRVFDNYDEIYCYASLAGGDMERYGPFEALDERQWDIAEHLGGENSRTVAVHDDEPLEVHVECWASNIYEEPPPEETPPGTFPEAGAWGPVWDLGAFIMNHPQSDWDGHVIGQRSSGGSDGHAFWVSYHICRDSCSDVPFHPPQIELVEYAGSAYLAWLYYGDPTSIRGFGIYRNGAVVARRLSDEPATGGSGWTPAGATRYTYSFPSSWRPACGTSDEFHVTTYGNDARESPRSNTVTWEGPPCPRTVRVIFDGHTLTTHDLCCEDSPVGPIEGVLWANDQRIDFDGSDLHFFGELDGLWLESHHEYDIETQILHTIARWVDSCISGGGCPDYWAPWDNTLTTMIDADEDLTFGVRIYDVDRDGEFNWRCLFAPWLPCWRWWQTTEVACEAERTIPAAELTPGFHTAYGDRCDLTVEIEELGP